MTHFQGPDDPRIRPLTHSLRSRVSLSQWEMPFDIESQMLADSSSNGYKLFIYR